MILEGMNARHHGSELHFTVTGFALHSSGWDAVGYIAL